MADGFIYESAGPEDITVDASEAHPGYVYVAVPHVSMNAAAARELARRLNQKANELDPRPRVKALKLAEFLQGLNIATIDLDLEVCLRIQDDDGNVMVGGLTSSSIDAGCTEIPMLVLDGDVQAISQDDDCDDVVLEREGQLAEGEPVLVVSDDVEREAFTAADAQTVELQPKRNGQP